MSAGGYTFSGVRVSSSRFYPPQHKALKPQTALAAGACDLLPKGHVALYQRAQAPGARLIITAQNGDFILKYEPTARMMNSTKERPPRIKAIRHVDEGMLYTDVGKIVQEVDLMFLIQVRTSAMQVLNVPAMHRYLVHGIEHDILPPHRGDAAQAS